VENWVKTFERMPAPLPVLVENTAGGDHAMARRFDALARLWDGIGGFPDVGFCLDTCHAHAGGEELLDVGGAGQGHHRPDRPGALQRLARRLRLGRGPARQPGPGADRPAAAAGGGGRGRRSGGPETPGGAGEHSTEIAWLRESVP
jgi:hypothetical protein